MLVLARYSRFSGTVPYPRLISVNTVHVGPTITLSITESYPLRDSRTSLSPRTVLFSTLIAEQSSWSINRARAPGSSSSSDHPWHMKAEESRACCASLQLLCPFIIPWPFGYQDKGLLFYPNPFTNVPSVRSLDTIQGLHLNLSVS